MNGSHTAENIKDAIIEVIGYINFINYFFQTVAEYHLQNKVSCIVTDNASNMTCAIRQAKYENATCFAHSLQLCLNSALELATDLIVSNIAFLMN